MRNVGQGEGGEDKHCVQIAFLSPPFPPRRQSSAREGKSPYTLRARKIASDRRLRGELLCGVGRPNTRGRRRRKEEEEEEAGNCLSLLSVSLPSRSKAGISFQSTDPRLQCRPGPHASRERELGCWTLDNCKAGYI